VDAREFWVERETEREREREREFVGDWIDLNPTCVTTTNTNQPIITITNQSPKY